MRLHNRANSVSSPEYSNQWESSSSTEDSYSGANGASPTKASEKGKERESGAPRKFRGIPDDVKLFEVFWQQIVALIKVCMFLAHESLLNEH